MDAKYGQIAAPKTDLKKLQIIQNKNLKIIYNLPRLYNTARVHIQFKEDRYV